MYCCSARVTCSFASGVRARAANILRISEVRSIRIASFWGAILPFMVRRDLKVRSLSKTMIPTSGSYFTCWRSSSVFPRPMGRWRLRSGRHFCSTRSLTSMSRLLQSTSSSSSDSSGEKGGSSAVVSCGPGSQPTRIALPWSSLPSASESSTPSLARSATPPPGLQLLAGSLCDAPRPGGDGVKAACSGRRRPRPRPQAGEERAPSVNPAATDHAAVDQNLLWDGLEEARPEGAASRSPGDQTPAAALHRLQTAGDRLGRGPGMALELHGGARTCRPDMACSVTIPTCILSQSQMA
mmetsp:Transcript_23537/g.67276  ORF Transcript_23537/g.67276 Transcript_23537/m.67276 type:complete len:296 (+) Transcript_23537:1057-1944(+)